MTREALFLEFLKVPPSVSGSFQILLAEMPLRADDLLYMDDCALCQEVTVGSVKIKPQEGLDALVFKAQSNKVFIDSSSSFAA